MRKLGTVAGVLVALWLCFIGFVYAQMHLPPEKVAAFMAKVPGTLFFVLPFETLWSGARGGTLHPGDPAPDFELQTLDKKGTVRLSSFRGSKPVVLIFGSYT